jgi:hypothetical protein
VDGHDKNVEVNVKATEMQLQDYYKLENVLVIQIHWYEIRDYLPGF